MRVSGNVREAGILQRQQPPRVPEPLRAAGAVNCPVMHLALSATLGSPCQTQAGVRGVWRGGARRLRAQGRGRLPPGLLRSDLAGAPLASRGGRPLRV